MRYAIIESGGKQYKAVVGETIEVDRLQLEVGKKLDLSEVLLVADGEDVVIGSPIVAGAKVATTVVDQIKAPKVIIFKYHPRKRYRLKKGHRQRYTRLMIDSVDAKGLAPAKPEAKVEAPAKAKTETPARAKRAPAKTAAKAKQSTPAKAKAPVKTKPQAKKAAPPKKAKSAPSTRKKLSGFDIAKSMVELLEAAGISTVNQALKAMEDDGKAILDINGIGPKGLEDLRKVLKKEGYTLP